MPAPGRPRPSKGPDPWPRQTRRSQRAHNNGGHRGQGIGSIANDVDNLALLGIFGQIDRSQDGNRRADKHGERRHVDGRDDRGPNAALGVDALRPAKDKVERDMRQAVDDHVGDDGDQHQRGDIGRGAKHAEHDLVGGSLLMRPFLPWERARLMRSRDEVVSTLVSTESDIAYPLFLEIRRTIPTSAAEMINKTTPMPNRAERCRPEE